MRVSIADELARMGIQLGGVASAMELNNKASVDLRLEWEQAAAEINGSTKDLLADPVIRSYRDFYWRVLKIDPHQAEAGPGSIDSPHPQ